MKYGVIITGGAVDEQIEMARAAEAAGWDGVFTWDGIHVGDSMEVHDPWVLMSAFAMATERVRIGAMIQPLARRRPWKVAREAVTLDHVSHGRFVLCVGLGAADDSGFGTVGEPTDRRIRAERLDETLAILTGLWSGEPFGFNGGQYRFAPMRFLPTPVQRPRIPIWVVGAWPAERSMARVARHDGLLPNVLGGGMYDPRLIGEMRDWLARRRESMDGFDVVLEGPLDPARRTTSCARSPMPARRGGSTPTGSRHRRQRGAGSRQVRRVRALPDAIWQVSARDSRHGTSARRPAALHSRRVSAGAARS